MPAIEQILMVELALLFRTVLQGIVPWEASQTWIGNGHPECTVEKDSALTTWLIAKDPDMEGQAHRMDGRTRRREGQGPSCRISRERA